MENNRKEGKYHTKLPEGIDPYQLYLKLLKYWYWIIIFGGLGILAGIFYSKISQPKYQVSSTLLIETDTKQAELISLFQDLGVNNKTYTTNILNQIGILKSYSLSLKTLQNLQWNVTWHENSVLNSIDLYQREPFNVIEKEGSIQLKMFPVIIVPVNEESYTIKIEGEAIINDAIQKLNIVGQANFGKPFKNQYFDFTINKIGNRHFVIGKEYSLTFNDLSELALRYSQNLEVKMTDEDSDLLTIGYKSTQPARAVNYLNELSAVYIQFGLNEKNRIANTTMNFIENQIASVTESLQTAGQDFTDFRSKNKIVDLGQEGGLIIEKMEEVEQEEMLSKIKLDYYYNLKKYLSNAEQMKDLIAPSVVGITDPALNSLVLSLSDLYSRREVMSYTVQEKNPNLIALDKEIRYTKNVLEENIANLITNSELELRNLQQQKQKVTNQLARLPKTEQNLINMKRSFDLNNDLYTFLLQRRAEAGIAKASSNPDAQILDPARIDAAVDLGIGRTRAALIGLIIGIGIPFILFTAYSYFDNRLNSIKDVESQMDLSIIGMIQYNKFKSELPSIEFPHSAISESFRGLKLNLQYLLKDKDSKVIAVHSSISGEGKSFVTLNLAASIAVNKKVLLIEADMRKPRLFQVLGHENDKGLSNYLNGKYRFDEVVKATKIKGLNFVAAGPVPFYPSELLNNGLLEKFIEEAKRSYDYIIFDNAPASIVNDAMMIAPFADANLFVLKLKSSTKNQLEYVNRLANEGIIKNMVITLNNVISDSNGFKNKSYGYYNEDNISAMNQKVAV